MESYQKEKRSTDWDREAYESKRERKDKFKRKFVPGRISKQGIPIMSSQEVDRAFYEWIKADNEYNRNNQ